jgi:hypothetical protein
MEVFGQERYDDNLRLKTGDFELIHWLATLPVHQQRLRQSDGVIIFESRCLLVRTIGTRLAIDGGAGACEDAT